MVRLQGGGAVHDNTDVFAPVIVTGSDDLIWPSKGQGHGVVEVEAEPKSAL
jgi:hypothetical protein